MIILCVFLCPTKSWKKHCQWAGLQSSLAGKFQTDMLATPLFTTPAMLDCRSKWMANDYATTWSWMETIHLESSQPLECINRKMVVTLFDDRSFFSMFRPPRTKGSTRQHINQERTTVHWKHFSSFEMYGRFDVGHMFVPYKKDKNPPDAKSDKPT